MVCYACQASYDTPRRSSNRDRCPASALFHCCCHPFSPLETSFTDFPLSRQQSWWLCGDHVEFRRSLSNRASAPRPIQFGHLFLSKAAPNSYLSSSNSTLLVAICLWYQNDEIRLQTHPAHWAHLPINKIIKVKLFIKVYFKEVLKNINFARIAKAALHKLPGKSSLNVRSVCPVCPVSWLSCLSCVSHVSWLSCLSCLSRVSWLSCLS